MNLRHNRSTYNKLILEMSFVLSYTVHKISDAQCITLLRAIGAPGTALRLPSGDLGLGDMSPGEREGVKSDHTRDTC